MEEIALRWIERVGFPIFVACLATFVLGYVIYRLFGKYEEAMRKANEAVVTIAALARESNVALSANTAATHEASANLQEFTATMKKKLGSDPQGLCQATILKAAYDKELAERLKKELHLTERELEIVLRERLARQAN